VTKMGALNRLRLVSKPCLGYTTSPVLNLIGGGALVINEFDATDDMDTMVGPGTRMHNEDLNDSAMDDMDDEDLDEENEDESFFARLRQVQQQQSASTSASSCSLESFPSASSHSPFCLSESSTWCRS